MEVAAEAVVGRNEELREIRAFIDDVVAGHASALLLEGEAGIGKTTLWRTAVEDAAAQRMRILQAWPAERERLLSFAALTDLVAPVWADVRERLPPPQQQALEVMQLLAEPEAGGDGRTAATAFVQVLATLAEEAPLLVAVDDVQWLDRASEAALAYAARRLPPRTGLLVAQRAGPGEQPPLGLESPSPIVTVRRVAVGPLSLASLHHAIGRELGFHPTRPLLARIAEASGGNPFFAIELARASAEAGSLTVPPVLREVVDGRLRRLSSAGRAAVTLAAATGRPDAELIARAGGASATSGLEEALDADVLRLEADGRIRFSHPLLAEVALASAPPADVLAAHRALSGVVDDPEGRARHLAECATGPDGTAAAAVEAGARAAERRGAPAAAVELYEAAVALTPPERPDATLARRLRALANALLHAGDLERMAEAATEAVDAAPAGPPRAEGYLMRFRAAWFVQAPQEAVAFLEQAREEVGDGDPALRRRILTMLARYATFLDPTRALAAAEAVLPELEPGRDDELLGRALIGKFAASVLTGRGADAALLQRGVELELRGGAPIDGFVLPWFCWTDDEPAARARWQLQDAHAAATGNEVDRAERLGLLARAVWQAGRWDEAAQMLDEACTVLSSTTVAGANANAFLMRAHLDAERGRFDAARSQVLDVPLGRSPAWWNAHRFSVLGSVEFAAGDHAAALDAWARMAEELDALGVVEPFFDRADADRVEAHLTLGQRDEATAAVERLEWRGRTIPRLWIDVTLPRARALVLAENGEHDAALDALGDVDEEIADALPFELARTLLLRGRIERRLKQRKAADTTFARALATFERLGAAPWAERTRQELSRTGLRRNDADLTETEARIAQLAASGLTNKEIAAAAFVSPKTVEANLARVYRKLGIRSRAELGARMAKA